MGKCICWKLLYTKDVLSNKWLFFFFKVPGYGCLLSIWCQDKLSVQLQISPRAGSRDELNSLYHLTMNKMLPFKQMCISTKIKTNTSDYLKSIFDLFVLIPPDDDVPKSDWVSQCVSTRAVSSWQDNLHHSSIQCPWTHHTGSAAGLFVPLFNLTCICEKVC